MTTLTHVFIGIVTAKLTGLPYPTVIIGSVLPDIDQAWASKRDSMLFSHRGWTHHIIVPIIMFIAAHLLEEQSLINKQVYLMLAGLIAGYTSHLLADSFTTLGIPAGLIYRHRLSFSSMKTGSAAEYVLLILGITLFMGIEFGGFEWIKALLR